MPKAVFIAPPLNTATIPDKGAEVTITSARLATNVWTTIGTQKLALGLEVQYDGKVYSQLFSLDKAVLTGSIGRILVSQGIEDTEESDFEAKIQRLVGKVFKVVMKGGKLYWYP